MGVKSTVMLGRDAAINRLSSLYMAQMEETLKVTVARMPDAVIESELERLNDLNHGGEGFENYSICDVEYVSR